MTVRTVTVRLRAEVAAYLAGTEKAKLKTQELRREADKLNDAGNRMSKGGLIAALGAIPGLAAPAAAGLAVLPAFALSSAAAFGTLVVATNGVGDALKAVSEGDADKFAKAMKKLSGEAQDFVRAYEQIRPLLSELGDATQDAFFHELNGSLELLTRAYLPTMMQQMPKVAAAWGAAGKQTAAWASTPAVVAQVNRQFALGAGLVEDFGGLLRSGTGLLLDMADAGASLSREIVQGMTHGTDAFRSWLETARGTGQLADLFDNAKRILSQLTDVAAEAGDTLFDAMANPALADATGVFLDIVGLLLQALHGVLQVFELLPPGMQSVVATSIAVGAAVLILVGRVVALKAALESAKASAVSTGIAMKGVGAFMAGPWGIAITAATVAISLFAAGNAAAQADVTDLRDTLDEQTGALTDNTRAMVVNKLEQEGVLRAARGMKLDLNLVTEAAMGNTAAITELNAQLKAMPSYANTEKITDGIEGMNGALTEAQKEFSRKQEAMGGSVDATTGKIRGQERAVKSLGDTLRAQSDPAFALIKAQKDLVSAQTAYTKAIEKHGPKSKEAEAAALTLAQQSIELADAVDKAGGSFDGNLTPQMEAAMRAAGMTTEQINIIKQALKDAKKAGDAFAKGYAANVTVTTPGLDAALAKMKRLAELSKKMGVSINAYDPEGLVSNRRWGGITTHARMGTLRQAGAYSAVSSGARYAFAEPGTGGEAFVPRHGDYGRSMSILSQAASWYGAQVSPAGAGTAASGPITLNARIFLGTREITDIVRVEVDSHERKSSRRADVYTRS